MVGKSNNVLVEYDYQNIILIDPNKLISDDGKAEERLVDHEDLVMYANLTCKLIPRTKMAIGADIRDSIGEVTLAEINFMSQQTIDGKNALNNIYTDEMTGKDTLQGKGINQPRNTSVKKPTKDGKSQDIITQDTVNKGVTGSFNTGLLGITSISIKTSGSFIPTVTIEFEDVRGRALFERGEKSPYAAFFHLPYPIFYLTIKGYYGMAVKYPLQLHTFNTRFNTMTGNYQITCVFYSYKYGVLADLTMGALQGLPTMYLSEYQETTPNKSLPNTTTQVVSNNIPSPSIGNTNSLPSNTNNQSTSKNITMSKGTQKLVEVYADYKSKGLIPKSFPEINLQQLKHKLETLEDIIKSELGKQDMGSLTDADTYSENLKNYRLEVYSEGNDSWTDKNIDRQNFIYDKNKVKIFFLKPEIAKDQSKIDRSEKDLQEIVDRYNAKLGGNKTFGKDGKFNGESFGIPNQINLETFKYGNLDAENGIDYEYTYIQRNGKVPNDVELTGFTKTIKDFLYDKTKVVDGLLGITKTPYFFDGLKMEDKRVAKKGFINYISEMLGKDGLQKRKEIIEKKLSEIIANILESNTNGLGFRPTIRNITAIILACSEAFLRLLDDVHKSAWEVRNEKARKNAILNNPGASSPENKSFVGTLTETTEYPVYPWPQFFMEKKDDRGNTRYEVTYPGDEDVIGLTQAYDYSIWPEVEFEEEFIRAIIDRNKPPLPYVDNATDKPNRLSLNAIEFPIAYKPYAVRQLTKFAYEMWERFILAAYYNGFEDKNLASVIAEMEVQNIEQAGLENDPYLLNMLANYQFNSSVIEGILKNISNEGVGESYQLYDRSIFVTPYIKNSLNNSFVILGQEYYDQSTTSPRISLTEESLNKLNKYITGSTQNVFGFGAGLLASAASFINKPINNILPFGIDQWSSKNLSKKINEDIYRTNQVLVYNTDKKLIANYSSSTQDFKTKRPYTNLSMYIGDLPKVDHNASIVTINNKTISNFYTERYKDKTSNKGQLITEGIVKYKNYTNQIVDEQTTSLLNTPYFINSIQKGVENYLSGNASASNPPYVASAYLFLNSLPLATLKERYINIEGSSRISDLDYLFAAFKKNSALHKLPYVWVLKYGSIWHRYKRFIETGKDFISDVWKDFDYKLNWDPDNTSTQTWDIDSTKITLQQKTGNNINIGLGFYPKTINDFNIFYQAENIFNDYSAQTILNSFKNNKVSVISGSSTANKFFLTGHNLSNTAETLNFSTYTFLSNSDVPSGKFVMPSFGSNINQTYYECFSGDTLKTNVLDNKAMYNGSVRIFHGLPNYGYFDNEKIDMPSPKQYIKKIFNDDLRQVAFSLGDKDSYSSIEDIFAVFDKEALDQFEIQFLNWSKSTYDTDGILPTNNDQFEGASDIEDKNKTDKDVYKNFQRLFRKLMFIDKADLPDQNLSSSERIKKIQDIQYRNFSNITASLFEYDVVIKYGNPTFFDRRIYLSVLNIDGNGFGNTITDPVKFGFYGDLNSSVVPDTSTGSVNLASFKSNNPEVWKTLETYVGFSTIKNVEYSSTGSTITDFFKDMNISFNSQNIKVLAPLIKIFATEKRKNPSYNKQLFLSDLNVYLNRMKNIRDTSYDIFAKVLRDKLKNVKPIKRIRAQGAPLQGSQTRVELWEMFKALNDKWLAGNDYNNRTLFEDILFLDRASRDIGDKVYIDIYKLKEQLTDVNPDGRVMGFVLDFVQANNFVAMSVPAYVNFYNAQDAGSNTTPKIEGSAEFANSLFGTHLTVDLKNSSPKLICFYADKVSEHPEIENSEYRWGSDSFDLRRFSDNPLMENQVGKNDWSRSNKVVGFNVDVGIRNQNMFSNVILSQDPGKATAESLRILDLMASSASGKQTATQNVSLFNLYKSRSYTCTVESMGNALIQPTMYFNLRHVPMFNGPYMILSVEHSIQPGTFRTTFSGVRQSKYSLPLVEDFIQNIYKIYLSKFIENVRNEIAKEETKSSNTYAIDANNIQNSEEKSKVLSDCKPTNTANAQNYTLTNDKDASSSKVFTDSDIKQMIKGISDVRTRLMVFSAIYNNSYKNGNYYAYGNNLIGFNLDYTVKGNLATYLTKQYNCVQADGKKIPLAIFKDTSNMVQFATKWFENHSSKLEGSIETMARQTLLTYTATWQETTSDSDAEKFVNSERGSNVLKRFENANKEYLIMFPEDRGKTFGTPKPTQTPTPTPTVQANNTDKALFENSLALGSFAINGLELKSDGSLGGSFKVYDGGLVLSKEYDAKLFLLGAANNQVELGSFKVGPQNNNNIGEIKTSPNLQLTLQEASEGRDYRLVFGVRIVEFGLTYVTRKVLMPIKCPDEDLKYLEIVEVAEWDRIKDNICCNCYGGGYTSGKIVWNGTECPKSGC